MYRFTPRPILWLTPWLTPSQTPSPTQNIYSKKLLTNSGMLSKNLKFIWVQQEVCLIDLYVIFLQVSVKTCRRREQKSLKGWSLKKPLSLSLPCLICTVLWDWSDEGSDVWLAGDQSSGACDYPSDQTSANWGSRCDTSRQRDMSTQDYFPYQPQSPY